VRWLRWPIVRLILAREIRDQLRDRRTLFMVFVLPILLYPMLILGVTKLADAFQNRMRVVAIVGAEHLPETPPLLVPDAPGFDPSLFDSPAEARLYQVHAATADSPLKAPEGRRAAIVGRSVDVIVVIPEDAREQLADEGRSFRPELVYDSADERSRDTARAVREVFERWSEQIVRGRLEREHKPEEYLQPVRPQTVDVAPQSVRGQAASPWARLFPFLLVIMALTGAFYPAIDLCAGEKERGTMETLLITPATRAEIVVGKFLAVSLASIATAVLNLASMGLTAMRLASQFGSLRRTGAAVPPLAVAPSMAAAFWMLVMLVPVSVFFSALSVALAAMARSMKEGQYYLTPLYIVALPLVFVALAPGVELTLFTSLLPITGVALLLRALMLGQYAAARTFFLPVLLPTVLYAALALRWAIEQFRSEAVLFREAERFDLRWWLVHLVRDRGPTPTAGQALLAFALMLVAAVLVGGSMGASWTGLIGSQVAFILVPTLALTFLLTSRPAETLRLRWPAARFLGLAVGLALALHPLANELRVVVEQLFPIQEESREVLERLMATIPSYGTALLALALVPAVCEEAAFRGFVLSGLERDYRRPTAVVLSALLFGFLHVLLSLFQQLFNAALLGLVLGLLAVRSGSLLPGIVFHAINNGLALLVGAAVAGELGGRLAPLLFRDPGRGLYHVHWSALGAAAAVALVAVLVREGEPRRLVGRGDSGSLAPALGREDAP
jgi:sodium transport system permease protein